jgi:two-component system OmpR family sensor kinase
MTFSIRRRLLFWVLACVLAGGLVASVVVFFQASAQANELFDYQLRQLALTLRDRSYSVTRFAEVLQGEDALDFVIAVWAPDGRTLYESHPHLLVPAPVQLGFNNVESPQGRWRVFAIQQRGLTIQVSQPMGVREQLALRAAWRTLLPYLIALPLMGFLIWRLVGHEVRFLESTAQAVAKRSPRSLEPISDAVVPEEVQPLVDALNGLLARLDGAFSQQRQFIADAAHELRSPLTALRLQLQLAERAHDPMEREKAHGMLREGIARASRVVEQLLTLARADPEAPIASLGEGRARVDVAQLVREVAEASEVGASAKGLAMEVHAGDPVIVEGDRVALRALLENLVDNAIRYTAEGRIRVSAFRTSDKAVLEVEDTGVGIPPEERGRVFDRFYRGGGATGRGTGLGLAIVKRVAERHGGGVTLEDGAGGRGLKARVTLSPA